MMTKPTYFFVSKVVATSFPIFIFVIELGAYHESIACTSQLPINSTHEKIILKKNNNASQIRTKSVIQN